MSLTARDAAIRRFTEDPDCKIFLMSLKAGGVALNLTVASHVSNRYFDIVCQSFLYSFWNLKLSINSRFSHLFEFLFSSNVRWSCFYYLMFSWQTFFFSSLLSWFSLSRLIVALFLGHGRSSLWTLGGTRP